MIDFKDIRGQEAAKRAMLVALAGNHSIMLYGPAGWGKTMLINAAKVIDPEICASEIKCGSACTPRAAISILDRHFDIYIEVPAVSFRELTGRTAGTSTQRIKDALAACENHTDLTLSDPCLLLGKHASDELGLNARSWHAIVRVARTIANLDRSNRIQEPHVAEAVQYTLRTS